MIGGQAWALEAPNRSALATEGMWFPEKRESLSDLCEDGEVCEHDDRSFGVLIKLDSLFHNFSHHCLLSLSFGLCGVNLYRRHELFNHIVFELINVK